MGTIFILTLRALTRGRRLLAVCLLLAIPPLLSLLSQGNPDVQSGQFAMDIFYQLMIPILLPLTTLVLATSALGGEVEDGTLQYLTLKPVSRMTIVIAKLLAVILVSAVLVELSSALTYLIAEHSNFSGQDFSAILLSALAGCIAYTAVFLPLGLLWPKRALIVGFMYVLIWEGLFAGISTGLATLSVRHYVQGVLLAGLGSSPLASLYPANVSGLASLIVVLALLLAGGVLTTWRLMRIQLP